MTASATKALLASAALGALSLAPAHAQQAPSADELVRAQLGAPAVGALGEPDARQGRTYSVNGADIFVEESGSGPDLVLLHGYPLSGALFARLRPALEDHFTVVTLDHRGYGQSDADDAGGTIETYAEDALAVLDQMGIENAIIGGMSMGGPITFSMYEQDPDRFGGMILIDTTASAANPAEAGLWDGTRQIIQANGMDPIYPALLPDMLSGTTRLNEPEVGDYLVRIMKGATDEAGEAGAQALRDRPDATDLLSRIDVPTLVLVGQEDALYSMQVSKDMASKLPDGQLAIVPGASHAAVFEAPGASAGAILRWASSRYDNVEYDGMQAAQRTAR